MEITKEHLEAQIKDLQTQKEFHANQHAACEGAIQATRNMLKKLEEQEPTSATKYNREVMKAFVDSNNEGRDL